jgi:type I restriction enzyme M protein
MSDENIIYLVPPGSIRCCITGTLRKDTPEENVRQRWARSLVEEYGYPKSDIMLEVPIHMGTMKKRADIVIFNPGAKHVQENALIIIETKRDDVKASDKAEGEGQLKSYMAASSSCKFGLWVGRERFAYERSSDGKIELVSDIPRAGEDRPRRPERADLQVAHDLAAIFRRCHNYIYGNGGLQTAEAFHEMLKLIFCKVYDEEEGQNVELNFAIGPKEQRSESGKRRLLEDRIQPLFAKVRKRYPYIFQDDEHIKLEPGVLAYIVSEMQFISLVDTTTDVKGAAYEELVGENLRGGRGEYFTRRNVCDMTVRIIQSLFTEEELTALVVLDCCCGTGGFLVSWIDNLQKIIRQQEERRRSKNIETKVRDRIREICTRYLFGLDVNPALVKTSQMNLVMHGDGSTNVFRTDSLRSPGEWADEPRKKIPFGEVDVLLTNPPFGSEVRIDDPHILERFELSRWDANGMRTSMPAEQLFVESAMMFLKEGGILGIVLPDGILNNPGLRFLRSWLLKRARIIASIDLPKETFSISGGVNNPSVLIVQKFTSEQVERANAKILDENHMVFLSSPRTAGIDKRGKPIFLRYPDGREILDKDGNRTVDDEISAVAERFIQWHTNGIIG